MAVFPLSGQPTKLSSLFVVIQARSKTFNETFNEFFNNRVVTVYAGCVRRVKSDSDKYPLKPNKDGLKIPL